MSVAVFVVQNGALLNRLLGNGEIDLHEAIAVGAAAFNGEFKGIEKTAGVPVGHIHEVSGCFVGDHNRAISKAALCILQRALEQVVQVVGLERKQPEQP